MGEPLFVFIALSGAAVLGFLFANTLARKRATNLDTRRMDLELMLQEKQAALTKSISESEARLQAVENLQKISQEVENQAFENEKQILLLRNENARLQEEVQVLTNNPIEKIKEIDVIREVPILIFREFSAPESRKEKAKKLMKAFKKGYLDEHDEFKVAEEKISHEE